MSKASVGASLSQRTRKIWDANKYKLVVYLMEGVGLPGGNLSLRLLAHGKQVGKTAPSTRQADPVWNEIFVVELPNPTADLTIEVLSKTEVVAEGKLGVPYDFDQETVIDEWFTLEKVSRRDPEVAGSAGDVHIRLYLSSNMEYRDFPGLNDDQSDRIYHYPSAKGLFKAGDVIVYDEVGLLPTVTKLTSCSSYSGLGVLVKLPSKYTLEKELYVAEFTPALETMNDAYTIRPKAGLNFFPLFDRLHQASARKIWVYPLKGALGDDELENLTSFLWSLHSGDHELLSSLGQIVERGLPSGVNQFLTSWGISPTKDKDELLGLASATYVLHALAAAGKIKIESEGEVSQLRLDEKEGGAKSEFREKSYVAPIFVLGAACLSDPVLLREPSAASLAIDRDEEKSTFPPLVAPTPKKTPKSPSSKSKKGETDGEGAEGEEKAETPSKTKGRRNTIDGGGNGEVDKKKGKKEHQESEAAPATPEDKKAKAKEKAEKKKQEKEEKKRREKEEKEKKKGMKINLKESKEKEGDGEGNGKDEKEGKEKEKEKEKKSWLKSPRDFFRKMGKAKPKVVRQLTMDEKKEQDVKAESLINVVPGSHIPESPRSRGALDEDTVESEGKVSEKESIAEKSTTEGGETVTRVQKMLRIWKTADEQLDYDQFSHIITEELKFNDGVALSLWDVLGKTEDNKILSTMAQTSFCIAMCLVSAGDISQRLERASDWLVLNDEGKVEPDDMLNFVVEFFYLGAQVLDNLSNVQRDLVDLIDVRVMITDLIAALDPGEGGWVTTEEFYAWIASADYQWKMELEAAVVDYQNKSEQREKEKGIETH